MVTSFDRQLENLTPIIYLYHQSRSFPCYIPYPLVNTDAYIFCIPLLLSTTSIIGSFTRVFIHPSTYIPFSICIHNTFMKQEKNGSDCHGRFLTSRSICIIATEPDDPIACPLANTNTSTSFNDFHPPSPLSATCHKRSIHAHITNAPKLQYELFTHPPTYLAFTTPS